jgi:hypothetical protein
MEQSDANSSELRPVNDGGSVDVSVVECVRTIQLTVQDTGRG